MEYKKMFVRHSSHHYAFQNQKDKKNKTNNESKSEGTGLLSVFTSLLAEPLSKMGSSRTSADHLTIELVLHLIRNLLSITPLNTFGSTEKAQHAAQLHREFLVLLEEEMVFDVLTCVGQEVERRENSGYNLLLMEILSCLLRGQDPTDVALSAVEPTAPVFETKVISTKKKSAKSPRTIATARASTVGSNSLKAHLQSERQKLQLSASSRHSHFGGTLKISKGDGKQVYVSASDYLARKSQSGAGGGASRR
jgi:timeless